MNLRESVGIALGGVRANKLRSFLTLLGIIIGVASVIAVVSFVEGLNRFVPQKLLNAGANVFQVDKYGFITSQEAFEAIWRQGNTVIVVTHEPDVAEHARRLVRMRDGRMESDTVNANPKSVQPLPVTEAESA